MRFVIYDDESLEAITVIDLPLTDRCIEERGRRWRVAQPPQMSIGWRDNNPPSLNPDEGIVDLWFERFVRERYSGGRQEAWMCFTKATDLAMLLDPSWLPGQYPAINRLKDENAALHKLLAMVLR